MTGKRGPKPTPEVTQGMWEDYSAGMTVEEVADKWGVAVGRVYARFRKAGLPLRKTRILAGAMYFDYCLGLELDQVAQKWGYHLNTVRRGFRDQKLPLRKPDRLTCSCRTRNPHQIEGLPFSEANRQRTVLASEKRRAQAESALKTVTSPLYRSVLQARLDHPEATLTELAYLHDPPMTKDAFAAVLRRATAAAK